ncbi:carboxypeptidase regulatory-like domain-containing protein [Microbacterium sp. 2P01SA-2]|uniref:MSCRAMM family protein n=1 Tax=unclassified Microbacterium TaxID=2609290 RepID=UPI0039A3A261
MRSDATPLGTTSTTGRRWRSAAALVVAAAWTMTAVLGAGAAPASAAQSSQWGQPSEPQGTAGARTGSVAIAELPALNATIASTASTMQRASGASTWLSEGTPIGARYGSSRDEPYLTIGARGSTPSVTTYTFDRPTPATGWAFALGDIDADQVRVTATAPDGSSVPASGLGFRGGFNYCEQGLPGRPSCSGVILAGDVARWDADTQILIGNDGALDTSGAAGWFEPSVPLATLTFEFSVRSGTPIYQTWFASLSRGITGTVTDVADERIGGTTLELRDPAGSVIATTESASDGTYAFPAVQASDGYSVTIVPPTGQTADVASAIVDLSVSDAVADFVIRDVRSVAVTGTVVDDAGEPVADVVVSLDEDRTAVTTTEGAFEFTDVDPGAYQASLTPPDGFEVVSAPAPFTVEAGSEEPVTDQDFVIAPVVVPVPTGGIAGVVLDADEAPVAGAVATVVGADVAVEAETSEAGVFAVDDLPPGVYTVALEAPEGFTAVGDVSQEVEVRAGEVVVVAFAVERVAGPGQPEEPGAPGTGNAAPPVVPAGSGGAGSGRLAASGAPGQPLATTALLGALVAAAGATALAATRARARRS